MTEKEARFEKEVAWVKYATRKSYFTKYWEMDRGELVQKALGGNHYAQVAAQDRGFITVQPMGVNFDTGRKFPVNHEDFPRSSKVGWCGSKITVKQ
jgi:hypothetical protein